MTSTGTRTASFTITDARYIGAKVGTDLRLLNNLYGRPALADIDDYTEEVALLLRDGYFDTVSYGFKDLATNEWKLRLRYTATTGGHLVDSSPGSLPTARRRLGLQLLQLPDLQPKFRDLPAVAAGIGEGDAADPTGRS